MVSTWRKQILSARAGVTKGNGLLGQRSLENSLPTLRPRILRKKHDLADADDSDAHRKVPEELGLSWYRHLWGRRLNMGVWRKNWKLKTNCYWNEPLPLGQRTMVHVRVPGTRSRQEEEWPFSFPPPASLPRYFLLAEPHGSQLAKQQCGLKGPRHSENRV